MTKPSLKKTIPSPLAGIVETDAELARERSRWERLSESERLAEVGALGDLWMHVEPKTNAGK